MKKVSLFVLGFIVVSSAQAIPPQHESLLISELTQKANLMPPIDPGEKRVRSTLQVQVMSNGCTGSDDFKIDVRDTRSGQFLTIVRLQPDLCETVPHIVTVELLTRDLRLASENPIVLLNPALANEQVVH